VIQAVGEERSSLPATDLTLCRLLCFVFLDIWDTEPESSATRWIWSTKWSERKQNIV